MQKIIVFLAVTGGPGGGKTTTLAKLAQFLEQHGYLVLFVPETATRLITSGITPLLPGFSNELFQRGVLEEQLWLEDRMRCYTEMIDTDRIAILCDRGARDGIAYMNTVEEFEEIAASLGHSLQSLGDARYAGVIHLVTAADGAEKFYTCENNLARSETPAQARALDARTYNAWLGVEHLIRVDNTGALQDKIRRAIAAIARTLGIPEPHEIERKWIIHPSRLAALPPDHACIDIEQIYLLSQRGREIRVRRRSYRGHHLYYRTRKSPHPSGEGRIEEQALIGERAYVELLNMRLPGLDTIHKRRHCFLFDNHLCELDVFKDNLDGLAMLEIEVPSMEMEIQLPPWLEPAMEVTDNPLFLNRALANPKRRGKALQLAAALQ